MLKAIPKRPVEQTIAKSFEKMKHIDTRVKYQPKKLKAAAAGGAFPPNDPERNDITKKIIDKFTNYSNRNKENLNYDKYMKNTVTTPKKIFFNQVSGYFKKFMK